MNFLIAISRPVNFSSQAKREQPVNSIKFTDKIINSDDVISFLLKNESTGKIPYYVTGLNFITRGIQEKTAAIFLIIGKY